MHTNLIWSRSHAFVFVVCCQLLAVGQSTEPPSQLTLPPQQQPSPRATPNDNQPATQPSSSQPGQPRPARSKPPQTPREQAWHLLESGCASDKTIDRATATLVLGLIPNSVNSARLAEKALTDDKPEVRSAAAKVLARDPDPATTRALTDAAGDKSWIVQTAALEALAKRGDRSALNTVAKYMADEKDAVRYTAAAAVLRLTTRRD